MNTLNESGKRHIRDRITAHNIAYSSQSGLCKQNTFVRLEQTFVFQTS